MFIYTMALVTLSFSFSTVLTSTPASLSLWILTLALLTSLLIGLSLHPWFGLIIFLIYIGGMLVMFTYFTAIQPNQEMNLKPTFFLLLISPLFIPISMKSPVSHLFSASMCKIYSLFTPYLAPALFMLAILLFLALVAVVKISKSSQGPLRPFNFFYV